MSRTLKIAFLFITLVSLTLSCKVNYSFSGASIDYNKVKTFSVKYFQNYAPQANPTLSQTFTEALKDVFLSQTQLRIVPDEGDLQFEGSITGFNLSPVAITEGESAALTRLTITVNVKFVNTSDASQNFENTFSRFADYNNSRNFADVEQELIKDINNQLSQDIFNKSVSNW
ncbi:MAG: LptE family protein [Bacteroidetes bacterium]|nr:hypothetical protein [Bacteroidota bacterium]MBV6460490.1 hypothetical protein [Flavobacteriales bacterium]WKZ74238.1 MAG: LptE family protein [Vicingaceae bacterium]MCL4815904.1 hypothetical protein [Flavobacteriales bacterium]NOG94749.1 LptE family protein [Bacteroidota bacterium]